MLAGLLSAAAGDLYDALVREGAISLDDPRATGEAMAELIEKGFARRSYRADPDNPVIAAVEPAHAVDNAILAAQKQALDQQRMIVAAREQLHSLQAAYRANNGVDDAGIELITDPKRIGALSVELCLSAHEEFVSFSTVRSQKPPDPRTAMTFPAAVADRGVVLRAVYERAALGFDGAKAIVDACVDVGWQLRVAPELPMKMVIADRHTALVPIDPSGSTGAMLIRTPTVVAALRMLFELVWGLAVPVGGREAGSPNGLTPAQAKVLDLLATGMTDGAIARHLDISERTVRRHLTALLEVLQADNRVAAVYAATRLGWLR
ncbi:regulatory protein, luxR family [Actinokineospora alba]|uniref:Regulatory protein, luxR family n=1 Tax=Actinokineospora alba TaxID=504798 RepID=A0A1H0QQT0_9PSEU|nr:LuxR C-terminal-related transcriptional regulator [Actinokineospora alba]TDP70441.1 regulatory LuxR family protein [Actinokineospora alba]SDI31542.1 regulatory protein, luxR family [Actinokineospora alba]SDP19540.1 regulatory protein, luxR family [Actinokineospora alba]